MTTGDLFRTLLRRWYVVVIGLLATFAGAVAVHGQEGVYTTRVDVQLIPPPTDTSLAETRLVDPNDALIALAGLIERELGDDEVDRREPVSPDTGLVDIGVVDGTLISLPNSGGQWGNMFNQPVLRVQAVAPTAEEAADRRNQAVASVRDVLERLQDQDGVAPRFRVASRLVPASPPVRYAAGHPTRATAVTGLIGLGLTCGAAVAMDRLMRHRSHRRARARVEPATTT